MTGTLTAVASAWHQNTTSDHFTRHPEPGQWVSIWHAETLTDDEKLCPVALHEAAHTVQLLLAGVPVHHVEIRTKTEATVTGEPLGVTELGDYTARLDSVLTAHAAGERAEDRGLREHGLWTPVRAWAVERMAGGDRQEAARLVSTYLGAPLTYGTEPDEWSDLARHHQAADEANEREWPRIQRFAEALLSARYLDARQVARLSGLPNPAACMEQP